MKIHSRYKKVQKLDKRYLWHPFTQMKDWQEGSPVVITEGRGSYLKDMFGKWYIDGVSSLWVSVHGHRKNEIDEAIRDQISRISHSTLLGMTHPPAATLAAMLIKAAPKGLTRVFYSDNGSTAVEIALKMAFQYWQHKGRKRKVSFLSFANGYHGDTIGAVSVGGIDIFHKIFSPLLFQSYKAPSPYCYRCEFNKQYSTCKLYCLKAAEGILKKHHKRIAGVILEPLVQGAGGMITAPPGFLKGVKRLCRKYDVLFIADEVATGFGRTGRMFACEHEGVIPDILCLAKGITGGYLPLAATITAEKIYKAFLGKYEDMKAFFHGHTYTGNQLACAAAIANLEIFKKERTLVKARSRISLFEKELGKIAHLDHVGEIRQCGFMVGIELVRDRRKKTPYPIEEKIGWRVCNRAIEKGLIIRPLGNVVVLMPPLTISRQEIKSLARITAEAIQETTESYYAALS